MPGEVEGRSRHEDEERQGGEEVWHFWIEGRLLFLILRTQQQKKKEKKRVPEVLLFGEVNDSVGWLLKMCIARSFGRRQPFGSLMGRCDRWDVCRTRNLERKEEWKSKFDERKGRRVGR